MSIKKNVNQEKLQKLGIKKITKFRIVTTFHKSTTSALCYIRSSGWVHLIWNRSCLFGFHSILPPVFLRFFLCNPKLLYAGGGYCGCGSICRAMVCITVQFRVVFLRIRLFSIINVNQISTPTIANIITVSSKDSTQLLIFHPLNILSNQLVVISFSSCSASCSTRASCSMSCSTSIVTSGMWMQQ